VKNTEHIVTCYKAISKRTAVDQSELCVYHLEQVAIQIWVGQLVVQLSNSPWQTCNKSPAARLRILSPQQKSTCVVRVKESDALKCFTVAGCGQPASSIESHSYHYIAQ